MPFVISNPIGFLALLGIPAILLIHFLQRRAQVIPCSTLFLLNQTQKKSTSGRKFDKLINSLALWMQLLAVLLITLLLIQPRYIKSKSTQRIAIVLDSSASMSVFKKQAKEKILAEIPKLQSLATHLEIWVLDSDLSKDRIYHGDSVEQLATTLEKWEPQSGTANPHHVLRIGRSLVGHEGAIVYVTDTPVKSIPFNASVLSVGSPHQNIGFTGVTFETNGNEVIWRASVRNYSTQEVARNWHLETDLNTKSEAQVLNLEPGELKVLQGAFPEKSQRIRLVLEPDDFTYDDSLPLIKPEPKQLAIQFNTAEKFKTLTNRFTESFQNIIKASSEKSADLDCHSAELTATGFGKKPAIVFLDSKKESPNYVVGDIVSADHPLTEGLNWQKLLISDEARWTHTKWDTPLVWLDDMAIIFLREIPLGLGKVNHQLVFNFDITASNGSQQESIALLLYRFFEQQRANKTTLQQSITELSQPLELKLERGGRKVELTQMTLDGNVIETTEHDPKHTITAPDKVGFYQVKQGENDILNAANYFADTREADLSKCEEGVLQPTKNAESVNQHSDEDHYWRIWLIILLLALLFSWKRRQPTSPEIA